MDRNAPPVRLLDAIATRQAPEAAAADAALLFFDFFAFAGLPSDAAAAAAVAGAVVGAEAVAASEAAALLFFERFVLVAVLSDAAAVVVAGVLAAGVGVVAGAGVAAALLVDFVDAALAPVGAVDEPLMVRPAASRFVTDFVPIPLTRVARSSASLNGPFFARSSRIAFAWTGPMPFTDSSAA